MVDGAFLAFDFAFNVIGGVELHARLRRENIHRAARLRIGDARGQRWRVTGAIQNKVVIVAFAVLHLLICGINARSDRGGLAKIKWRSFDTF